MDTEVLVENRIPDGWKLLADLIRDGFDVTVAFWAKTGEGGLWFLYIGSSAVDGGQFGDALWRVYCCLRTIRGSCITPSDIKLIHRADQAATDAAAIRDRYAANRVITYRPPEGRLGGLSTDEVCIYPRILGQLTPEQVMETVVALMNRPGVQQPSTVTLRGGREIRAIPYGIRVAAPGRVEIVLRDVDAGTDLPVVADDVMNIQ
jgi:hypothetical protein